MKQNLDKNSRIVLTKQLEEKKQEQYDLSIQIKEIDFQINELLDLQIRIRKKKLREMRHEFSLQQYNNAMTISDLERVLYNDGYNIKEEETNG